MNEIEATKPTNGLTVASKASIIAGSVDSRWEIIVIYWSLTMYAVIKTGGKQYRVQAGEKLKIEQIPADVGSQIVLDQVLMLGTGETVTIGTPLLAGAQVSATVLSQGRADKVRIFKMRRRKHYQKRQGHRQNYTEIQIGAITA